MIYQLDDDHIDLRKVELISNIKEDSDFIGYPGAKGNGNFYFDFQVNGVKYSSDMDKCKENIEIQREHFLNEWKEYKEERL